MKFTIMAEKLKQILNILTTVENEMRFEFSMEKLHIRAVDPANSALIDLDIDNSEFVTWDIDKEIDIGVDLVKFNGLVSKAGKLSDIAISIEDRMGINFDGMNFELSMLDPGTLRASPRIPDLNLPISTNLDLDIIKSAIKGTETIDGEMITIITNENLITFSSVSKDGADKFKTDPIETDGNFAKSKAMYSLDYLGIFNKFKGDFDGEVAMKYNTDMPVIFEYQKNGIKFLYMVAPRISTD